MLDARIVEAVELMQRFAERASHFQKDALRQPAERRLAFRELGLALGLRAVEVISEGLADGVIERSVRKRVELLLGYLPLRDEIESFWRDPEHQGSHAWMEHLDINEVMLATSLAPEGFLILRMPLQANGRIRSSPRF